MNKVRRLQICFALAAALVVGTSAHGSVGKDEKGPWWGWGVIVSPGYRGVVSDSYQDVSGAYGWFDLEFGYRFETAERLFVGPHMDMLLNFHSGDDTYVNVMLLPSLSLRYEFDDFPPYFYMGLDVNYGLLMSGSDRYDATAGRLGFGLVFGAAFSRRHDFEKIRRVEIGYLYVPTHVTLDEPEDIANTGDEADVDFGGIVLRYIGMF